MRIYLAFTEPTLYHLTKSHKGVVVISALAHHLNKIVLVAIPSIFGDEQPKPCTLLGIEGSGVWLESTDLAKKLLGPKEKRSHVPIFVPFTQVVYLIEPDLNSDPNPLADQKKAAEIDTKAQRGAAQKKRER
jgi:hypothetical protein